MSDTISNYTYRDLGGTRKAVKIAVVIFIVVALIGVVLEFSQLSLLNAVANGQEISMEEAEASDRRVNIALIAYYIALIVAFILFLRWLYVANKNASALSQRVLDFSPGWAVGCFFVPIVNLWKPYQAVKEVIEESDTIDQGGDLRASALSLLPIWWMCRVALLIIARINVGRNADTLDEISSGIYVSIGVSVIEMIIEVMTLILVTRITTMQQAHHAREEEDGTDTIADAGGAEPGYELV